LRQRIIKALEKLSVSDLNHLEMLIRFKVDSIVMAEARIACDKGREEGIALAQVQAKQAGLDPAHKDGN
jgi:hypothetical protein